MVETYRRFDGVMYKLKQCCSGKQEAKKRDKFKDYQLKREGWRVIRIKEEEMDNLDSLLSSING